MMHGTMTLKLCSAFYFTDNCMGYIC